MKLLENRRYLTFYLWLVRYSVQIQFVRQVYLTGTNSFCLMNKLSSFESRMFGQVDHKVHTS